MATVTIEPVAWRYRVTDTNGNLRPGWRYSDEPSILGLYKPLFTAEALAQARAEGRAEGMRQAANLAKWFGGEANMLQNDNVDRELNVARRDAAYKIQKRILAAIPQEQIEALTEAERELVDELSAPEHNPPSWDRWVNFDPDFRQKDIARLVRRGWVEKRGAPPHREYRLTEAGRALHSKEQLWPNRP